MRITTELQKAFEASGMTLTQFANKLGTYPANITRWKAGTQSITADRFVEWMRVAGCKVVIERPAKPAKRGKASRGRQAKAVAK